jgi:sugar-specific transcriptional regulator TrmB
MIYTELVKAGLSPNEAKLYLAALELGESSIAQIAKKAGVKRTSAYLSIEALKEKGLISQTKRRRKNLFYAENPKKIEAQLEEKKSIIQGIMPELLSINNLDTTKPAIRFFEGDNGIKEIYKDTLSYPDQELLAWTPPQVFTSLDKKFIDEYVAKRANKKIWVRMIIPDVEKAHFYKQQDQASLRKTKIVPCDRFHFDVEINLYGGKKIGVMAFEEKIGLIIESKKIYNTLKSIFENQWESI